MKRIAEPQANGVETRTEPALPIQNVSNSMAGDGMNSLEFFDMIKREWCVSEEQWKPFWNDVLTFARKYSKERTEYCG